MPLLAANRKDTRWQIDWGDYPCHATGASKGFQYGGIVAEDHRPVTQSWSHCLVIRPAAALRWNPGNVAVRILDVTGFAVDAVLGIDHEAGA
jgi:hypothetical protein